MRNRLILLVGYTLFVGLMFSSCARQWVMNTSSMEPAIKAGERVFVHPVEQYTYGDVIAIEIWRENDIISNGTEDVDRQYRIYRLMGMPGDTIEVKDNFCIINGQLPQIRFIRDSTDSEGWQIKVQEEELPTGVINILHISTDNTYPELDNMEPIIVPKSHYFVLGDYRTSSADSRIIGCVPFDKVKGKVIPQGQH